MRTLQVVGLFLRDTSWTTFAVLACSALPVACLLLVEGDGSVGDWPYYLFLTFFAYCVFLAVRLARSWDFYSAAQKASREPGSLDWGRVGGSNPEARWARHAAAVTGEKFAEEASALAETRSERDAIVLSWVHHAKTPIAVIKLIAESGHAEAADMERVGSAARELERSLDSLLQSVRVSSPEADLRITKVDLALLARNCINGVRDLFIEREVYPSFRPEEGSFAYGDQRLVAIVLDQLLTNAVKYSPPSSQVTVCVGRSADGRRVEVSIEDEGCGISPEDAGRVFRPFFTGANGRRGEASTGIGLFLAKKAADATGAELSLAQREGGGTVALVSLPAAPTPQR